MVGLSGCWGFRVPAKPKNGLRGFKALRSALCRLSLLRAGGDSDFAVAFREFRASVSASALVGEVEMLCLRTLWPLPLGRRFGSGSEALVFRALE